MRRVVWFLLLAGCLAKPPRPGDVEEAPSCTNPPVKETFDDTFAPPCGTGFGNTSAGATLDREGSRLHLRPGANAVSDASCTWVSFEFSEGTFVELRQPVSTGGSFTVLQVALPGQDTAVSLAIIDENSPILIFGEPGQPDIERPYDEGEMRWLRLRPEAGLVAGEFSKDGERWTRLGVTTATPAPDLVDVSLNGGAYNALADPGEAVFDNFNVCP